MDDSKRAMVLRLKAVTFPTWSYARKGDDGVFSDLRIGDMKVSESCMAVLCGYVDLKPHHTSPIPGLEKFTATLTALGQEAIKRATTEAA